MDRSAKGPPRYAERTYRFGHRCCSGSGRACGCAAACYTPSPRTTDPPATDTFNVASGLGLNEQNRPPAPAGQAPSDAEVQARAQNLIDNQHRNDDALEQYERTERHVDQTASDTPRVLEDRLYRVVPTGTGTMKLLLKDNGKLVDPADYHKQLIAWRDLLEIMLKPEDPRSKSAYEKWQKKKQERKELVDAARDAFLTKWLGPEMRNGRLCDVFQVDPNPNFHPHSIAQDVLTRVGAKIWVDHATDQLVRGEAHIIRDLSFGGGSLASFIAAAFSRSTRRKWSPESGCRLGINMTSRRGNSFSRLKNTSTSKSATTTAMALRNKRWRWCRTSLPAASPLTGTRNSSDHSPFSGA